MASVGWISGPWTNCALDCGGRRLALAGALVTRIGAIPATRVACRTQRPISAELAIKSIRRTDPLATGGGSGQKRMTNPIAKQTDSFLNETLSNKRPGSIGNYASEAIGHGNNGYLNSTVEQQLAAKSEARDTHQQRHLRPAQTRPAPAP